MSNSTNILVLGLAGNPVTLAHTRLLTKALDLTGFDGGWLLPCYKHNFGKDMVASQHRLAMCDLAIKGDHRLFLCSDEIVHSLSGGTYVINKLLMNAYPNRKFHYLIGMDNANQIDKWANSEKLKKEVPFVVVPRGAVDPDKETWFLQPPHRFLNIALGFESSTSFRTYYKSVPEVARDYVAPAVFDYIVKHGLYQ